MSYTIFCLSSGNKYIADSVLVTYSLILPSSASCSGLIFKPLHIFITLSTPAFPMPLSRIDLTVV
ncbi:hypothetical protein D2A91_08325 [Enterococcus faecalis]|nr:hypothetical protein [Enterococcus faecalis]